MSVGKISVNTDNLLPIIKKWLYSDRDIFIRELVSNACDAIAKLKKLISLGQAEESGQAVVKLLINKEAKTITIEDNGIGMTAQEVEKYITQVAFSGAEDFLQKYKDKGDEGDQIIGHFGLGFYSCFMVSDRVDIDTLSYEQGAESVFWSCDGGTEYEISTGTRTDVGTTITLHISEEAEEFLDIFKTRSILEKYCGFLPVSIMISDGEKEPEQVNDPSPLWLKKPSEVTDEEYIDFYKKVFSDYEPPLFWMHLNVDFPFNLKGILYFPKLRHELDAGEGRIKLYNNQVFVADNIKEVIPEFLLLLKGAIDCPDLPLNVSRSFLQNDGYVTKVSNHITKKVADKLNSLFNTSREQFEGYWDDIHPFVKYGCLKDEKFYEKVKDVILFKTTDGKYKTLKEYLEYAEPMHKDCVYYVTNQELQAQYVDMYKEQGMECVLMNTLIDTHFISMLERQAGEVKFKRCDSELADHLRGEEIGQEVKDQLVACFEKFVEKDKYKLEVQNLKNNVPAVMLQNEQARRFKDMSIAFAGGMPNMFPDEFTLVLNKNSAVIMKIMELSNDSSCEQDLKMIADHIVDMALLSIKPLEKEQMTKFLQRSATLLEKTL